MTEDIIVQSEPEKQDKNQILEKRFQNLSDFELKILQRVRFRIKKFTTRQILNKNFYNASDFEEEENFKKHDFEKKLYTKITFCLILPRKMRRFCVLRAL